jgi:hypothetical protein
MPPRSALPSSSSLQELRTRTSTSTSHSARSTRERKGGSLSSNRSRGGKRAAGQEQGGRWAWPFLFPLLLCSEEEDAGCCSAPGYGRLGIIHPSYPSLLPCQDLCRSVCALRFAYIYWVRCGRGRSKRVWSSGVPPSPWLGSGAWSPLDRWKTGRG